MFSRTRLSGVLLFLALVGFTSAQEIRGPVVVKFHEPKVENAEIVLPIDPKQHIRYQYTGAMGLGLHVDNQMLCCGDGAIRTSFRVDGQSVYPNTANASRPLKPLPTGKQRLGIEATHTHNGNIVFTQTVEIVPSRPDKKTPGQKRKLDTVLIRYVIENKDTRPHTIGARVRIDAYCVNNDGSLCASPTTHPGQILNGLELKGKNFPPYVQFLQNNDLKNPGFVGHFTFKFENGLEGPDRFLITRHGAGEDGWNIQLIPSQGDSDWAIFWEPKEIKPGGRRIVGYGYGRGLASDPLGEGKLSVDLAGSFEPDKTFVIRAYVDDPMPNQTLHLELPRGMALLEGKEVEPVPQPSPGTGTSFVLWKGRVLELGEFPIRIHSSSGVSETRTVTISSRKD